MRCHSHYYLNDGCLRFVPFAGAQVSSSSDAAASRCTFQVLEALRPLFISRGSTSGVIVVVVAGELLLFIALGNFCFFISELMLVLIICGGLMMVPCH